MIRIYLQAASIKCVIWIEHQIRINPVPIVNPEIRIKNFHLGLLHFIYCKFSWIRIRWKQGSMINAGIKCKLS